MHLICCVQLRYSRWDRLGQLLFRLVGTRNRLCVLWWSLGDVLRRRGRLPNVYDAAVLPRWDHEIAASWWWPEVRRSEFGFGLSARGLDLDVAPMSARKPSLRTLRTGRGPSETASLQTPEPAARLTPSPHFGVTLRTTLAPDGGPLPRATRRSTVFGCPAGLTRKSCLRVGAR